MLTRRVSDRVYMCIFIPLPANCYPFSRDRVDNMKLIICKVLSVYIQVNVYWYSLSTIGFYCRNSRLYSCHVMPSIHISDLWFYFLKIITVIILILSHGELKVENILEYSLTWITSLYIRRKGHRNRNKLDDFL